MKRKIIAIAAGEPNSISSEIIFKVWSKRKKFVHLPFFIVGSYVLLEKQRKNLKFNKIKLKKVTADFSEKDLLGNALPVLNINYNQNVAFRNISKKSRSYIFKCLDLCLKFISLSTIK